MKYVLLMLMLTGGFALAQKDVTFNLKRTNKGYEYINETFPNDILVFQLDKSKHMLKAEGVTLVQVWTLRDGTRPDLWNRVREIEKKYKDEGLTTLSVNFENGSSFHRQLASLQDFFKYTEKPENLYFDSMGYVTDLLKVSGFPIYYLVDDKGMVIFRTLGEDEEGVSILEEEIQRLLKKDKD